MAGLGRPRLAEQLGGFPGRVTAAIGRFEPEPAECCDVNECLFCRCSEEAQFKDHSGPSESPFKGGLPQANLRTPRPSGIRNVHSDKPQKLGVLV